MKLNTFYVFIDYMNIFLSEVLIQVICHFSIMWSLLLFYSSLHSLDISLLLGICIANIFLHSRLFIVLGELFDKF